MAAAGSGTVEVLPWVALFAPRSGRIRRPAAAKAAAKAKAHTGPIGASFRWHLSGLRVDYRCSGPADACDLSVRLELPRLSGTKRFRIGGFAPHAQVEVTTTRLATGARARARARTRAGRRREVVAVVAATADPHGVAEFEAPAGRGWCAELRRVGPDAVPL